MSRSEAKVPTEVGDNLEDSNVAASVEVVKTESPTCDQEEPSGGGGDNDMTDAESASAPVVDIASCAAEMSSLSVADQDSCNIVQEQERTADTDDAKVVDSSVLKLQTLSTYNNLASKTTNHSLLLQDATVSGFLVLCLGDEDPRVVESSFEVFATLSKSPGNLPVLQRLNYFLDALRCVGNNGALRNVVRDDAAKLISDLKSPVLASSQSHHNLLSSLTESTKNKLLESSGQNIISGGKVSAQNPADLNTTMSTMKRKNKGRETVLFIENEILQKKHERTRITQSLIKVPGIISVTYDLKKNYCIVRGKRNVPPEDFGRAVAALEIAEVYLVRKNENKEEVKIHIPANDKENMAYPPYPEEVESEEVDESSSVAKRDQPNADNASFFKSAKNFIKRSFYW